MECRLYILMCISRYGNETNKTMISEASDLKAAVQSKSKKFGSNEDSLGNIKFGIDAEIEKACSLYCKDELCLSKLYWPKSFRSLSIYILETLLKKPDIWNEVRTPSFEIDGEQLQTLIDELKFPDSPCLSCKHRRWIAHLLKEVSSFRRKFGLSARLPNFCDESMDWPSDLQDKDDLLSSMTAMSLRDDVKGFIWKILDDIIPPERYCNMHYLGAIKSSKNSFPIVVEVTEDYFENVNNEIITLSNYLRILNYKNLLPVDLVEIRGVPVRDVVVSNEEEGFCMSASH